jgi:hypothetical protein
MVAKVMRRGGTPLAKPSLVLAIVAGSVAYFVVGSGDIATQTAQAKSGAAPPSLGRAAGNSVALAEAGPVTAWVADGMTQMAPDEAPTNSTDVELSAAQGETEPFQIGVRGAGSLTGVNLELSGLTGPGSATIAAEQMIRYREHFVDVTKHSPEDSGPVLKRNRFADALVPFVDPATGEAPKKGVEISSAPFDVESDRVQPLWVDVRVPRDTPAGDYAGTWKVTSDQGTVTGNIRLHVWNFALPVQPAADSWFGVYKEQNQTPAVSRMLLSYGLQPGSVAESAEEDLRSAGLKQVNVGGWSGAVYGKCEMKPAPSVEEFRKLAGQHLPSLEKFAYTADEISECPNLVEEVKRYGRNAHEAGLDQLVTVVPTADLLGNGKERSAVDIWVMLPQQLQKLDPKLVDAVRAADTEIWSYQALVAGDKTPSWQIDFPSSNFRILPGFLNAANGATGVLYWTVDYWEKNPWDDVTTADFGCCYPGDGTLIYPGDRAGVSGAVPSTRLAWIREGIEDYGYVDILRARGKADQVTDILADAASSWSTYTTDPAVIARVRTRLAEAIEAAGARTASPAAAPVGVGPVQSAPSADARRPWWFRVGAEPRG